MKKLIIGLTCMATAICAEAATCSWSSGTIASVPTLIGGTPGTATATAASGNYNVSMQVYTLTEAMYKAYGDDMEKAYAAYAGGNWTSPISVGSGKSTGKGTVSVANKTIDGAAGDAVYQGIVFTYTSKSGDDSGTVYTLVNTISTTMPDNLTLEFSELANKLHGGTKALGAQQHWTASVPEPTSGLLLVLGLAGLALKRKRA